MNIVVLLYFRGLLLTNLIESNRTEINRLRFIKERIDNANKPLAEDSFHPVPQLCIFVCHEVAHDTHTVYLNIYRCVKVHTGVIHTMEFYTQSMRS